MLFEFLACKRRIGGAESDGPGFNLFDSAARTDRLIVQTDAGLFLISVRPFGVDRVRERGAGAGNVGGGGRCYRRGQKASGGNYPEMFHCALSCGWNPAQRVPHVVNAGVGPFSRRVSERCIVGLALKRRKLQRSNRKSTRLNS